MTVKDFLTINDFDLDGKTILLRADLNSPMDPEGNILDDLRIKSHIQTINELINTKLVIMAHQSRPGKNDFTTMQSHSIKLSEYLDRRIHYIEDIFGTHARNTITKMKKGDIVLLENVRFFSEETIERSAEAHSNSHMVKKLSPLIDIYLNDAFAVSHRSHLSLMGFTELLPAGAGRLMEKEILALDKGIKGTSHPNIFVLGGAKVDDSLKVAESVLSSGNVDKVLFTGIIGTVLLIASNVDVGQVNYDFIKNQGYIDQVDKAKELLKRYNSKIKYPSDVALNNKNKRIDVDIDELKDQNLPINDIGLETIVYFSKEIENAHTVVLNGPAGISEVEQFALGTLEIIRAATKATYSIAGGGHIAAEVRNYGYEDRFSHLSTGGGACIDYLSGEKLPGIEALKNSYYNKS
ncbi:phosphoglycerate kinase [Methanosalsum natronophilum]|uniref:phosphoglycerate kinase n=1 Tax=Methanosalsum natronophilum TaxID=768733 RepID=UPI0035B5A9F4|nr:phosphoglycerate kinase [Methanosalsum natronophilum]